MYEHLKYVWNFLRARSICMLDRSISVAKHWVTAWLKGLEMLPRYSPIICLDRPFLVMRNLATACAELSRNPLPARRARSDHKKGNFKAVFLPIITQIISQLRSPISKLSFE